MAKFWLMDQHDGDGPTALVETDGRLQIVDIVRFGPSVTELQDQQEIWDKVIGRVAPTMKPLVKGSSIDESGVAPLTELKRGQQGTDSSNRASRRGGNRAMGSGPQVGNKGAHRASRGDR